MSEVIRKPSGPVALPKPTSELVRWILAEMKACGTWDVPTLTRVEEIIIQIIEKSEDRIKELEGALAQIKMAYHEFEFDEAVSVMRSIAEDALKKAGEP